MAAVTAIPTTSNGRPCSVIESPTLIPSTSAKLCSTTAFPPSRSQRPAVSFGWSTGAVVTSRPSICAPALRLFAVITAHVVGYGPLRAVT